MVAGDTERSSSSEEGNIYVSQRWWFLSSGVPVTMHSSCARNISPVVNVHRRRIRMATRLTQRWEMWKEEVRALVRSRRGV